MCFDYFWKTEGEALFLSYHQTIEDENE